MKYKKEDMSVFSEQIDYPGKGAVFSLPPR